MTFFARVYELVQRIPPGYVTTYGEIAASLGTRDARRVGHALHANPSGDLTPCHRVVNKDGKLSESYAFGGSMEQYAKLVEEGVKFIDSTHVDLSKCYFQFKKIGGSNFTDLPRGKAGITGA